MGADGLVERFLVRGTRARACCVPPSEWGTRKYSTKFRGGFNKDSNSLHTQNNGCPRSRGAGISIRKRGRSSSLTYNKVSVYLASRWPTNPKSLAICSYVSALVAEATMQLSYVFLFIFRFVPSTFRAARVKTFQICSRRSTKCLTQPYRLLV